MINYQPFQLLDNLLFLIQQGISLPSKSRTCSSGCHSQLKFDTVAEKIQKRVSSGQVLDFLTEREIISNTRNDIEI